MISIVVPVFNSEKYICRCIKSVINQTYKDWELILVDDGSTDRSYEKMVHFAAKDKRIKIIRQNNKGPGAARNTGIEYVTGEYTVFIDSDDYIKFDYLEKLSKENADVVFINVNLVDEDFNVIKKEHMSNYCKLTKDEIIRAQMTGKIPWGGVRKAVKTSLLINNKIRFSGHVIGEEAIYSFLVLYHARTISCLKGVEYYYFDRPGSQSNLKILDPWGKVAISLKNKINEMGLYDCYANTINAFITTSAIVSLDRIASSCSGESYRKLAKKRIRKYYLDFDNKVAVDFANMSHKCILLYPLLKLRALFTFYIVSKIHKKLILAFRKR